MAIVKQLLVILALALAGAAAWIALDPAPGRWLLAEGSPVPEAVRPAIRILSPVDRTPRVGATVPRDEAGQRPLVVLDPARVDITRDRLRAVGTGEAERSVAVYPEVSGIVTEVAFRPGDLVAAGAVLAVLEDEDERLALDRARILLEAAEAQLERYQALASSASVTAVQFEKVLRAERTARLDVRTAEIALARRRILAPIDGRVGLTPVQPGALVGTQTLIATVDDRAQLKVVFNVPEAFVPSLSVGHPVEASPTSRTGRPYEGEISALDSRLDEASRTLRTEALVDNERDELRPGMSFSVEIGFEGESYLSVDPLAIQWERAGSFVWTVDGEEARKAPVRIVERNIDRVLIASDALREGEGVVIEGVAQLREGVAVRVQGPNQFPPAPSHPENDTPSAETETSPPSAGDRAATPSPAGSRLAARGAAETDMPETRP